jgi:hypothetical protein
MSDDITIPPHILEEIEAEMAEDYARKEAEDPGYWARWIKEMEDDPTWPRLPADGENRPTNTK